MTNGYSDGESWFPFSIWDQTSRGTANLLRKRAGHPSGLGSQRRWFLTIMSAQATGSARGGGWSSQTSAWGCSGTFRLSVHSCAPPPLRTTRPPYFLGKTKLTHVHAHQQMLPSQLTHLARAGCFQANPNREGGAVQADGKAAWAPGNFHLDFQRPTEGEGKPAATQAGRRLDKVGALGGWQPGAGRGRGAGKALSLTGPRLPCLAMGTLAPASRPVVRNPCKEAPEPA